MGLGDEYSRDALFRRPGTEDYDSDPDREESQEPLHPEDWEAMYSDEIYEDICMIHQFVYDNHAYIRKRYGVAEYCTLIHSTEMWWSNVDLKLPFVSLWRRLNMKEEFDPQSFQCWLENYIQLY